MTLDYTCLGPYDEIRKRRYFVLSLLIKNATPAEIVEMSIKSEKQEDLTIKQVYNDLSYLRTHELHNLPLNMVRDINCSFFELKVTELERKANKYETNPSVWLGIQKLIGYYKEKSLQLQGALVEKVEHSGDMAFILKWGTDEDTDDSVQSTSETKTVS